MAVHHQGVLQIFQVHFEKLSYHAVNLASLTQLLQGGNPKLVIMVVRQWCSASSHDVRRNGLSRHLHRFHATDEGLEPLVGKRGLTPIQLYDPVGTQKELKTDGCTGEDLSRCSRLMSTHLSRS